MLLDFWTLYYAKAREQGNGELIEDDDFDVDRIIEKLEEQARERDEPASTTVESMGSIDQYD